MIRNIRAIILATLLALFTIFALLAISLRGTKESTTRVNRVFGHTMIITDSMAVNFFPDDFRVFNNDIYALDFKNAQVIRSEYQGKIITRYGARGKKPGEFELILSYDVDTDGLYIVDSKKHCITHFDPEGALISDYPNQRLTRAVHLSQDSFLIRGIFDDSLKNQEFIVKNVKTNNYLFAEQGLTMNNDGGLSTDGFFIVNKEEQGCYYVPYYTNSILKFDKHGHLIYKAETIDGGTIGPKVTSLGKGVFSLKEQTRPVHKQACCDTMNLFIISSAKSVNDKNEDKKVIVDVYAARNGNYLYSFHLPYYQGFQPSRIQSYKDGLLVLQGNYLVYYKLV